MDHVVAGLALHEGSAGGGQRAGAGEVAAVAGVAGVAGEGVAAVARRVGWAGRATRRTVPRTVGLSTGLWAGLCIGLLAPGAVRAQDPERPERETVQDTTAAPTCTWDACALRVEGGRLLQGIRGEPRGSIVGIELDVEVLTAGPDSAAAYAARFGVARPQSDLWSTFGDLGRGLALAAWIHFAMADDAADGWAWTAATLMPVSQAARAHARRQDVIATRAVERAVWWYNRELTRPPLSAGVAPPAARMRPLPADRSPWDLAPLAGGILGGLATSLVFDDAGWIVTGVLLGTSMGNGVAERRLH